MRKLIITDTLGDQVLELRLDDAWPVAELRRIAEAEARMQAAARGRAAWRVLDAAGAEIDAGEAIADRRPGLLPLRTPVLYCEHAAQGPLSVYGTVAGVRAGCYLVQVDHIDSDGRPVPIGAAAEIRVPVDTPPAGALRTLEAVQLAHLAAAE